MLALNKLNLDVKGKITLPDPTAANGHRTVVYQGASRVFANYYAMGNKPRMIRAFVQQTPSRSVAQAAMRDKLKLAVAAWHIATTTEKKPAEIVAKQRNITIYMAFVGLFIKNTVLNQSIVWDYSLSLWDGGTTAWDSPSNTGWDVTQSSWDNGASV
jgi:hypothetical protein